MAKTFNISATDIQQGKAMAGISYFTVIGFLLAMITSRDNRYVMYHAQQSLLVVIVYFIRYIPFTPGILDLLTGLFAFVLFIIGIINGFGGKVKPLPLIGEMAYGLNICRAEAE